MAEQTNGKASAKKISTQKPQECPQAAGKIKGRKPTRPLPTDRISFARQLDLLRAFAIASGDERRAVRNQDVAAVSDFAASTLSQANAFFCDVGFLNRTGDGFIPADEVFAFAHAFKWTPITAAFKLSPIMERSWVGETLLPRLQFRDINETEAVTALAEEVEVGPEYKDQLMMLLEYLEAADLVALQDGMVKVACGFLKTPAGGAPEKKVEQAPPRSSSDTHQAATVAPAHITPGTDRPRNNAANVFNLSLDIHVPMDELNRWPADKISAFFSGVAAVLAAKNQGGAGTTEND
jgi:hypothetical protein